MRPEIHRLGNYMGRPIQSGDEFRFTCPFCEKDNDRHLYFNSNKLLWVCFKCNSKGTFKTLLRKLGVPQELEDQIPEDRGELESLILELSKSELLGKSEGPKSVAIGYPCETFPVVKKTEAFNYLFGARGFSVEDIEHYSLVYGQHRGLRIFVPTFDSNGEMVYWVARLLSGGKSKDAKYVNPSLEKTTLFNIDQIESDTMILCEGVFSAMAAGRNAAAAFGKTLNQDQLNKVLFSKFKEIAVSFDSDAYEYSKSLAKVLSGSGKRITVVRLPTGHDPASLSRDEFNKCFDSRVEYDESNFLLEGLI